MVAGELAAYVIAAAAGSAQWHIRELDVLAALGVASFTAALILELARGRSKPERDWYEGRAAAESTKTLAWRFAVGGDPFPVDDVESLQHFIDRVQAVVDTFAELELPAVDAERTQVTRRMLELRDAPLEARRDSYREGRLREQRAWYVRRSKDHDRYVRRWRRFAVGATIAGILGGLARFAGIVDIDFLGLGAAAASAATAWNQLRQHQTLATSYALAAQELALAEARLPAAEKEADWALFVSDAEDAISREHTMWLAKRGHPRSA